MKVRANKGFSLIEVMIALVILAVGILGISKLQGVLIKNSSNANQRSVAISIAQKKIDDLKSYAVLGASGVSPAWVAGASTANLTAASLAYMHIESDKGGSASPASGAVASLDLLAYNASTVPTHIIQAGNAEYKLNWDVVDYMHTVALSIPIASTPASGDYSDMKLVTVTVAWNDETGISQNVSLKTVLDAYDPELISLSDPDGGSGGSMPEASYTPELAPDVIDVDVDTGDGQFRQTSKPLPDAVTTGANSNTLVSFEVVTYHAEGAGFVADIKEDFVTVDCECQFTVNGTALPPAHVVWNEADNSRYDYVDNNGVGALNYVSKSTATQVNNANAVDEICTTCCRDHHDVTSTAIAPKVRFDGQAIASDDHVHYQSDGVTPAIQASNHIYVESCRFKRVDGILRVFQDWKLYDLITMNRAALAVGGAGTLQEEYSTYVGNYILDQVGVTGLTVTKPDASTNVSALVGGSHQLESRGVYIDKVYDLDGNISSSYNSYVTANSPVNIDRLEKIPFSEVNLSRLTHWNSTALANATVTDEAIATIVDPINNYYGTYSRGYMTAVSPPGTTVNSIISSNNNGLTQIVDATNTNISDLVTVNIAAGGSPITITGTYSISYLGATQTPPTISPSGNCSLPGGNTYTCSFTGPWTGVIEMRAVVSTGPPAGRCDTGVVTVYSGVALSAPTTTAPLSSLTCS